MKTCTRCKQEKLETEFNLKYADSGKRKSHCRQCCKTYYNTPSHSRMRLYGITEEAFQALKEKQEHKCAICGDKAKLYVDHDHKTGKVRGLLCNLCNVALGALKDSPELLTRASNYLCKPS